MIYDLKETHKLEIQKQIINMYIKIIKYYLQNQMIFVISIQIMMNEGSYNYQTYFIAVAYMFDIKP